MHFPRLRIGKSVVSMRYLRTRMFHSMNKPQRVVLIAYFLSLAYCCLWIPWRVPVGLLHVRYARLGYGWIWVGPTPPAPANAAKASVPIAQKPDIFDQVASENATNKQKPSGGYTVVGEYDPSTGQCIGVCGAPPRPSSTVAAPPPTPPPPLPDPNAEPDLRLIALRFLAATTAATAAFLIAGIWKSSATRN